MTPDEILEIDAKRNHPPGTVAGHLRADINDNIKKNGGLIQQGDTLVMFRVAAPKTLLFCCFTADPVADLEKNLGVVFRMFKKLKVDRVWTLKQSPDVYAALEKMHNKFSVTFDTKNGIRVAEVRL